MAEPVATAPSAQDFQTPDRSNLSSHHRHPLHNHFEEMKDESDPSKGGATTTSMLKVATVTPSDAFNPQTRKVNAAAVHAAEAAAAAATPREEDEEDQPKVRFGKEGKRDADAATGKESAASVDSLEKKKRGLVSRRGGRSGSPGRSLGTSTSSPTPSEAHAAAAAVLEFKTFRSPDRKQRDENDTVPSLCSTSSDVKPSSDDHKNEASETSDKSNHDENEASTKPSSISYDASDSANSASPLKDDAAAAKKRSKNETGGAAPGSKKSIVTFSPVPPPNASDRHIKTPVRSPSGGRVASLPNLYDAPMGSPGGIFLSPTTPTALERKTKAKSMPMPDSTGMRAPLTPRTPKGGRDMSGLLSTPTDFAFDYGKHPMSGSLLDSSNVLSWLHSPSANGLFSPGVNGFGSMLNTPKGGIPRTPHTPTVSSTSFFFSDVAGLPRGSEFTSPSKGSLEKRSSRGTNSMICISPLSSHKAKGGVLSPKSPKLDMGMFASPAERSGMAKLGMKRGAGLDAVPLADRDLMEDDDLNRLLRLANNTPRPSGPPLAVTSSEGINGAQKPDGSISGLSLPTIGGGRDGSGAKLTRKTLSRDQGDSPEAPRPNVATSSSPASEDSAGNKHLPGGMHPGMQNPFMTSYHHHEAVYNPSLYPGMSHGGSMRVVVGGPPRAKSSSSPGTIRYTVGRPGDFPAHYPPPSHYPQHHGMPAHMHHQYLHYPPPPHHGAPRHMPLFNGNGNTNQKKQPLKAGMKRQAPTNTPKQPSSAKKTKKVSPAGGPKKKNRSPQLVDKEDRQRAAATIQAVNQASGGKNDKAAALAAAILRGVTMRPSGKWQAQLYFAGKSRYIGVFDTREKAALAYEIARERLKAEKNADGAPLSPKQTENAVNAARKAAFDGVNERGP